MKQDVQNKMSIRNIGVGVYVCVCGSERVRGSEQQQLSMECKEQQYSSERWSK